MADLKDGKPERYPRLVTEVENVGWKNLTRNQKRNLRRKLRRK